MKTWTARLGNFALAVVATAVLTTLFLLWRASIDLTEGGVHRRIILPLAGEASISLPVYSGTGEKISIDGHLDGPIVRIGTGNSWSARWFCEDRVEHRVGTGPSLEIGCSGKTRKFDLTTPAQLPDRSAMPTKVAVLSDIEGNIGFLEQSLVKAGIVDAGGAWSYGTGHLVILGDAVDRGRDAFSVLWKIYQLSVQAQRRGGAVHLVLGNHEQYLLRGNFSRAHPEHIHALNRLGGQNAAFASDTLIGKWLRQQPVALQLGSVLFVHGGIVPGTVDPQLSVDQLNATSRAYWQDPKLAGRHTAAGDAVFGFDGITQYRGYVMSMTDLYPKASDASVLNALDHFNVKTIVVAHTIVDRISWLYGGKVIAIDVNSNEAEREMLLFVDGKASAFDIGIGRKLDENPKANLRPFNLFSGADWRLLWSIYESGRTISALPHPY